MICNITKEDGTYYVDKLKTSEQPGQYKIRTSFEGDDQYSSSKSAETTMLVQEPVHNQDYSIAENLKKIPLSLDQQLESKQISILQGFRLFHAFKNIEKGFNEEKEPSQIISTVWLLSLLQFNPLPLGIYNKEGENLEINGKMLNLSADILASNNEGYSLVIDCTVGVPSSDKLDKLLNTGKYLEEHSGKRFIPLVMTNKYAPNSFEQAGKTGVIVIDKSHIDELLKLIMSNNIEQARELFLK